MKIDLHVHSKHSRRPAIWLLQKLGCPESFTEPEDLYNICRLRGMDAVTITDHNTIDGCLEIQHLPDTFVSEEVTTYFPESRCKVHVLVYGHTEAQHAEIQRIRENIFDLVGYLQENDLLHCVAHPLSAVNDRLEARHFEQLMLLFRNIELNGDQDTKVNDLLRHVIGALTSEHIERLVDRHGITPGFREPWRKTLISGSDDHASLLLGRSYTRVPGARTLADFFAGVRGGRTETHLRACSPATRARNVYAVAYSFCKHKFNLAPYAQADMLMKFLERNLNPLDKADDSLWTRLYYSINRRRRKPSNDPGASLVNVLRHEAMKLVENDPRLMDVVENGLEDNESAEHTWFAFVDRLANGVLATTGYQLLDRFLTGRVLDVFSGVGRAGALYSLLSPYFVTYGMAAAERELGKDIAAEFVADTSGASPAEREVRVGHFTDTYYEVNGVARTLQQWADSASRLQKALTIITCHENPPETYVNTQSFRPVTAYELPEYPEIRFLFPPILQMLGHCADQGYTHIHAATPGPIGLAALCIARILRRPCFGTYHTALPQYTDVLTDDSTMGRLMWQYMVWFYEQMDVVFVNSQASADELIDQGVSEHRLRIIPRGVDTDRFHPDAGKDLLAERFDVPDCTRLLYVGRISREKDLPLLVSAFRDLVASRENLHLVIVGDGPYREEMEAALAGLPATFTGYLDGDDLAAVYAESDLFVFPSTTDTFGNVVLEAQAAGIPVIVSDIGGPCENLLPEKTGRIVPAGDAERFAHAIAGIVDTPGKLDQMKAACRPYGESRSFDAAFSRMWDLYDACEQDVQRPARERRAEERVRASAPFAPPFARPTPEPVG